MSPSVFFNEIQDASGVNNMTAITIAKDQSVANAQRLFIGTNSGVVYTYLLDNQDLNSPHDSLYFVEEVQMKGEVEQLRDNKKRPVVSLHYSSKLELLFVSHYNGYSGSDANQDAKFDFAGAVKDSPPPLKQKSSQKTFPDIYFGRPEIGGHGFVAVDRPVVIDTKKAGLGSKLGYAIHFRDVGLIDNAGCVAFISVKDDVWTPVF